MMCDSLAAGRALRAVGALLALEFLPAQVACVVSWLGWNAMPRALRLAVDSPPARKPLPPAPAAHPATCSARRAGPCSAAHTRSAAHRRTHMPAPLAPLAEAASGALRRSHQGARPPRSVPLHLRLAGKAGAGDWRARHLSLPVQLHTALPGQALTCAGPVGQQAQAARHMPGRGGACRIRGKAGQDNPRLLCAFGSRLLLLQDRHGRTTTMEKVWKCFHTQKQGTKKTDIKHRGAP